MANVRGYLICGQSNAQCNPATASQTGFALAPTVVTPSRALEWESTGGLQELKDNRATWLGEYQALPGSAWPAFLNVMTANVPETIVVVRAARGGSSVLHENTHPQTSDWSTDGTRFAAAISRANSAIAAIAAAGHTLVSFDVIWHGGERDALEGNNLAAWQAAFEALLGRFRTALSRPTLKMYVVRVGEAKYNGGTSSAYSAEILARLATIRGYQDAACAAVDGMEMAYTGCSNFPVLNMMKWDGAHYSQTGYNTYGTAVGTFVAADLGATPEEPPEPSRAPRSSRLAEMLISAIDAVPLPPPAAGPAQFASIGTLKAHSTVQTIDAPAGAEEDDLIAVTLAGNVASQTYPTIPSGFTQRAYKTQGAMTIAVYTKPVGTDDTDEDTDTYTFAPSSGSFTAQAVRLTGVDLTDPIRDFAVGGSTTGEAALSVEGCEVGDLLFHASGINHGAYAPPAPAGFTDRNGAAVRMTIDTKDVVADGDVTGVTGGAVSGALPVVNVLIAFRGLPAA